MKKYIPYFVAIPLLTMLILVNKPVVKAAVTKQGVMTVTVIMENIEDGAETNSLLIEVYREGEEHPFYSYIATASGDYDVPISETAPDNTIITTEYYATATDVSNNVSGKSNIVSVTIEGADTLPPKPPVCGEVRWQE